MVICILTRRKPKPVILMVMLYCANQPPTTHYQLSYMSSTMIMLYLVACDSNKLKKEMNTIEINLKTSETIKVFDPSVDGLRYLSHYCCCFMNNIGGCHVVWGGIFFTWLICKLLLDVVCVALESSSFPLEVMFGNGFGKNMAIEDEEKLSACQLNAII